MVVVAAGAELELVEAEVVVEVSVSAENELVAEHDIEDKLVVVRIEGLAFVLDELEKTPSS